MLNQAYHGYCVHLEVGLYHLFRHIFEASKPAETGCYEQCVDIGEAVEK